MSSQSIVSVRGLCKSFGGLIALNNLDMEVRKGDIYGFLGPNGSGKSTTIKILLTLVKQEMGTVEVFDTELADDRGKILSRIGSIVEKPGFYERISAMKNLQILSEYSGIKKTEDELHKLFHIVGLSDRTNSKVGSYSNGMKQRLGFAQAIMNQPDLLILDEPFSGLDPKGMRDMRELILRLNKEKGMTVIISSHQLDEIENIANRMIIINKGSSVCEGSVKEIVDRGKMSIIVRVDEPEEAFQKLQNSRLPIKNIRLDDDCIKLNCSHDAIPYINQYLQMSDFKVFELTKEKALENYYLTYT
ncbi:MAG: ABC transporter ATP-binding protein [Chlorobi bacterium]|nr:ABC transporter ATP-binding protein [Chlorobiota bacterium]